MLQKKQLEIDVRSDRSSTYYRKVRYFENAGMEYLMGHKEQRGCKYDFGTGKIRDMSIKGDLILKYKMTMEDR